MALMDESAWRGKVLLPFGGVGASGAGARFGGAANVDAFAETRWVTVRGDITPCPF
jgi:benzaldehyde dehydrogenase (NAD)